MPDTPRNDAVRNTADKAQAAASETAETVRQGGEKIAGTARDGAERAGEATRETLNQAANAGSRAASQSFELGTRAVNAYVEAGKRASAKFGEANRVLTESYSRQLADYGELSRQAVAIRSPQDLIQVQQEALQKLKGGFDNLTQVYGLYIDAMTDSLQPLAENAAAAKDRFRDAA